MNDVGMTLFFALAAKEIVEATAPEGPVATLAASMLRVGRFARDRS